MWDFLDEAGSVLKAYGTDLKEAAIAGVKNTADITVAAAADVLKNAGTDAINKTASKGTVKQPAKGVNADGSTVLVVPKGSTVTDQGRVVSAATGMDNKTMMMWGAGIVGAVLVTVVIVKVLK